MGKFNLDNTNLNMRVNESHRGVKLPNKLLQVVWWGEKIPSNLQNSPASYKTPQQGTKLPNKLLQPQQAAGRILVRSKTPQQAAKISSIPQQATKLPSKLLQAVWWGVKLPSKLQNSPASCCKQFGEE
jgi:hypothetical protein